MSRLILLTIVLLRLGLAQSYYPLWPPQTVQGPLYAFCYNAVTYQIYCCCDVLIFTTYYPFTNAHGNLNAPNRPTSLVSTTPSGFTSSTMYANTGPSGYLSIFIQTTRVGQAERFEVCALLTPPGDLTLQVRHPSWNAVGARPFPRPQVALSELYQAGQTPPALRQSMTEGLPVMWSTSEKSLMIARGATASGFQVESEYLPGFTTMFCSGGQVFSPPRNIPSEVWPQLLPLLRFENNLKSVLTLGPRFAPEFPARDIIASEFLYGINRLAHNGQLSPNSAFLTEARKLLEIIIQNPDSPLPAFQSKPATPMEETLAKAIAISLGPR